MNCLLLLILGILPHDDTARESVDLIELNHFYDEHGRLVFDQIIFYDWRPCATETQITQVGVEAGREASGSTGIKISSGYRYQVRAWRLVKNPNQIPYRDWRCGGYATLWQDGEQMRFIRSTSIRETWTQYDPELIEREYLPKEKRRELLTIKVKKKDAKTTSNPADGPPGEVPAAAQPGP